MRLASLANRDGWELGTGLWASLCPDVINLDVRHDLQCCLIDEKSAAVSQLASKLLIRGMWDVNI